MNPFPFLSEYAWLLFIGVMLINLIGFKSRLKPYIEEKPEREAGYNQILKGFAFFGTLPWLVIGIGNLSGMTNSVFQYFQPRTLNPAVLAFHGTLLLIYILTIRWIFFKNGAEFMSQHPGIIRYQSFGKSGDLISPKRIKTFFALSMGGGIIALGMMWTVDIQNHLF
ncbi:hypothetical protein KFE98_20440 [bacterium SCSIO 12741]|nr:hypothetical protein KFE98_20440 [bacterium SCSIO 12741]